MNCTKAKTDSVECRQLYFLERKSDSKKNKRKNMEGCNGSEPQSLKNLSLRFVAENIDIYQQKLLEHLPEVSVLPPND